MADEEQFSRRVAEGRESAEALSDISRIIIGESMQIHRDIGPGLFESVYEQVLAASLTRRGLRVDLQVPVPLQYRGLQFEQAYRLDMLVENRVIVEVKSQERLLPLHSKQLLTYLRLLDKRLGLLINFGESTLKDGVKRVANS